MIRASSARGPHRRLLPKRLVSVLLGRAGAAAVDQAAFSLQNFLILFAALHWLTLEQLGEFTLATTFLILVQTSVRSLVLEPLTVRYAAADRDAHRYAVASASGLSLLIGALGATTGFLVGLISPSDGSEVFMIALLPVLVQDAWRFALFSRGRAWAAAANDLTCLTVTAFVLSLGLMKSPLSATGIFSAWSLGALAGACVGMLQIHTVPRVRCAAGYLRSHRDLGFPLLGSTVAQQLAGRLSLVAIATFSGAAALGAVSAARTLFTPLNSVISAALSIALPKAARERLSSVDNLRKFTRSLSVSLSIIAVLLTSVLAVLPESIGRSIAGPNWLSAQNLIVPTGLWIFGIAMSQGARVGLRALECGTLIFRATLLLGLLLLVATSVGTLLAGATGAAWGFGLASIAGQPLWSAIYRRARGRELD